LSKKKGIAIVAKKTLAAAGKGGAEKRKKKRPAGEKQHAPNAGGKATKRIPSFAGASNSRS